MLTITETNELTSSLCSSIMLQSFLCEDRCIVQQPLSIDRRRYGERSHISPHWAARLADPLQSTAVKENTSGFEVIITDLILLSSSVL